MFSRRQTTSRRCQTAREKKFSYYSDDAIEESSKRVRRPQVTAATATATAASTSPPVTMYEEAFNRPAFFRIMVGNFKNSVKIPPKFIRRVYRKNLPPQSIVLMPEIGEPVIVHTEKMNQNWLLSRGWPEFVREQRLKDGDSVYFSMMHKSKFEVFTLGRNCCSKRLKEYYVKYPAEEDSPSENSDEEEDSCFEVSNEGKGSTFETTDDEEEDSLFEVTDEEEDSPIKIISDDEAEASTAAGKRAKKEEKTGAPRTPPPSFTLDVKVYQIYGFLLPREFVKDTQLQSQTEVVLKNLNREDDKEWTVKLWFGTLGVRFSKGWCKFLKSNRLKPGSKLHFKLATGTRNVFWVQILSRANG